MAQRESDEFDALEQQYPQGISAMQIVDFFTPKGVKLREQVVELMTQPPAAIAALDEEDQLALRDILARAVENLHRGL